MKPSILRLLYRAMRVRHVLMCIFFGVLISSYQQSYAQQTEQSYRSAFGPNALVGYLAYTPADYAVNSDSAYPLLIFLHGQGEKVWNPQNTSQLYKVKANGPPKLLDQGQQLPFIVISPQCPFPGWDDVTIDNYQSTVLRPGEFVDEIIEKMKTIYRVDPNRIYITGLSMGGAATWTYTLRYPQKIAASIPIAGWGDGSSPCGIASNNVAVWAFQGQNDGGSGIQGLVNSINACSPPPAPLAKATIYAGVGHDAWTRTYDNTGAGIAPDNIYSWLLRQHKGGIINQNPVSNAGADKTLTLPTNSAILTGTGTDSDGSVVSYAWTKINGPAATLANANTSTLTLTGLVTGTYIFRLTVTDNSGATGFDEATVSVNPAGSGGDGLAVSYFPTNNLTGTAVTGISSTVNFDWTTGAPVAGISADNFSARWTGQVQPLYTQTYTFYTLSDDGIRLWVNGTQVVNNWTDHGPVENSGTIALTAGVKYSIVLEYYEKTGGAVAKLSWSSTSQAKQVIPQSQLFSNTIPVNGTGLKAEYFSSIGFTGTPIVRTDTTVNYDWLLNPPFAGFRADSFSVRWTGKVKAAYSETYTFYTLSDDGVRLTVNGQLLIDNWTPHGAVENTAVITLVAGQQYDILLEYYERTSLAAIKLSWSSASQPKQIIPKKNLYVPVSPRAANVDVFTASEESAAATGLQSVYPVPATNALNFSYTAETAGVFTVSLVDPTGQPVLLQTVQASAGTHTVTLNVHDIKNGLYILILTGNGITQSRTIVITK